MSGRRGWLWGGALGALALAGGSAAWWWRHGQTRGGPAEADPLQALWSLELQQPEGGVLRLAEQRGRWLLVNFWATWCPPCVREMPVLDAFHKAQSARQWQVIGIAADNAAAVSTFLKQQPVSYPVALAGFAGIELSRQLGNLAGGLPFTVVITPQGAVAHRHMGELKADVLQAWAQ